MSAVWRVEKEEEKRWEDAPKQDELVSHCSTNSNSTYSMIMNFDIRLNGWLFAITLFHFAKHHTGCGFDGIFVAFQEIGDKVVSLFLDAIGDALRSFAQELIECWPVRSEHIARIYRRFFFDCVYECLEDDINLIFIQQGFHVDTSANLNGQVGTQGIKSHLVVVWEGRKKKHVRSTHNDRHNHSFLFMIRSYHTA